MFSLDATTALIQTHVPDARLLATAGAEATFTLRRDAAAQFPALLTALEERRVELGVEAWGMAATTLEEVFLKYVPGSLAGSEGSGKDHFSV